MRSPAGWSAAERLQRRASSCCRSSQWMTLGAWTPSTSLAGTTTQPSPSSTGGCGCGEGERGGSGAADDGAGSSIAADHARGRGVGGRRELRMGGRAGGGSQGGTWPCGKVLGALWEAGARVRRRLFLLRRAAATAFGWVWFGLALAWPGLVGIVVVGDGGVHSWEAGLPTARYPTLGPVLCLAWVGPNFLFCGNFAHEL